MRLHRFYVGQVHNKWGDLILSQTLWLDDQHLVNQLLKVLRYKVGDDLILFNEQSERLYKVTKIDYPRALKLDFVTEIDPTLPDKHIYLMWSLLKKDKNDWVIQKATELGVRNFVPILADRSEKTGFDIDRAKKIIIEDAEQCGRFDIPNIREPITISEVLAEYKDLPIYICEQGGQDLIAGVKEAGVLIGPEGGWSDIEKQIFRDNKLGTINLSYFTLRAETASVVAASKLTTQ